MAKTPISVFTMYHTDYTHIAFKTNGFAKIRTHMTRMSP